VTETSVVNAGQERGKGSFGGGGGRGATRRGGGQDVPFMGKKVCRAVGAKGGEGEKKGGGQGRVLGGKGGGGRLGVSEEGGLEKKRGARAVRRKCALSKG